MHQVYNNFLNMPAFPEPQALRFDLPIEEFTMHDTATLIPSAPSSPFLNTVTQGPATGRPEATKKKSEKINSFIFNLYKMLEDPECREYVFWLKDGQEFGVLVNRDVGLHALAKHYRSNNEQSFTRQLNMYGFARYSRQFHPGYDAIMYVYQHPYFIQGRTDLLCKIKRKDASTAAPEDHAPTSTLPPVSAVTTSDLFDRVNKLEELYQHLKVFQQQMSLHMSIIENFYRNGSLIAATPAQTVDGLSNFQNFFEKPNLNMFP